MTIGLILAMSVATAALEAHLDGTDPEMAQGLKSFLLAKGRRCAGKSGRGSGAPRRDDQAAESPQTGVGSRAASRFGEGQARGAGRAEAEKGRLVALGARKRKRL